MLKTDTEIENMGRFVEKSASNSKIKFNFSIFPKIINFLPDFLQKMNVFLKLWE